MPGGGVALALDAADASDNRRIEQQPLFIHRVPAIFAPAEFAIVDPAQG